MFMHYVESTFHSYSFRTGKTTLFVLPIGFYTDNSTMKYCNPNSKKKANKERSSDLGQGFNENGIGGNEETRLALLSNRP
jgi:hypothetical protein